MSALFESLGWFSGTGWVTWLLDLSLKAAVLLLLAFLVTGLLRGASASVRHHIWTLAFAAVLALPILSGALPSWRVPVLGWESRAPVGSERILVEVTPSRGEAPGGAVPWSETGVRMSGERAEIEGERIAVTGDLASRGPAAANDARASWLPSIGSGLAGALLLGWIAGALLLLARLATGVAAAWRTSRTAEPVEDPTWSAAVRELADELGVETAVTVVRSERVRTPMAWGVFRPVLLLPDEALGWSAERRRAVLLHELAHIRRRDCLVHLLAQAARALHWVNPLAWIGARRLRAERERACDDMVLDSGTRSADYARLLLDVARARGDRRLAWATVSMARPSELEGRLLAILDPARDRRRPGPLVWIGSLALMAGLTASLAALQAAPSAPEPPAAPAPLAAVAPPGTHVPPAGFAPQEAPTPLAAPAPVEAPETAGLDVAGADPTGMGSDWIPRVLAPAPRPVAADTIDERVLEALLRALANERASIREQAAHTLGMIESPQAVVALSDVLRSDASASVRSQAAWALGMIEDEGGVPALTDAIRDEETAVRSQAAWALGMIESSDGVEPLLSALSDASADIRSQAAWALGTIESSAAVDGLIGTLRSDESPGVREQAAWALGTIESSAAVEGLVGALRSDESPDVREQAAWALGTIEDPAALDALIDALEDESDAVAEQAMWALGQVMGG